MILGLTEKNKLMMMVSSHTRLLERKGTSHEAALWLANWIREKKVCEELDEAPVMATALRPKGTCGKPGKDHGEIHGRHRPIGALPSSPGDGTKIL